MKICLINSLYAPDTRGGAEYITEQTARALRDAGHDVLVITTQAQKHKPITKAASHLPPAHEEVEGVRVYRLAPHNLFTFFEYNNKPLWQRLIWLAIDLINRRVAKEVGKVLDQEKPDVVHTHNIRGLSYLVPRTISRRGIKHIHTLHDIQFAFPMGLLIYGSEKYYDKFFIRSCYEYFCKKILASPDMVISPSAWLLNFYNRKKFFKKSMLDVVKNPVDFQPHKPHHLGTPVRETVRLLYIGQAEWHKGIGFLVSAIKKFQLTSHKSPVSLKVIGDGSELEAIKKYAQKQHNINFLGRLPRNDIKDHLLNTDILVMPTLTYENSPNVILEAFSYGIPVLASDLGGIPELIDHDATGWLFEPGNKYSFLTQLEHAIDVIQDQPKQAAKMQQKCIQAVGEHSIDFYVKRLEMIYAQ